MQKARIVGVVFLLICGLVIAAVAQGILGGRAPLALFPTPQPKATNTPNAADAVVVQLVYSSDKKQWLTEALSAWQATNPQVNGRAVRIDLVDAGSQQIINDVIAGKTKPTMVSPASTMQITQLNAATVDGKQNIAADAQSLVLTPLVIVAWKDANPNAPVEQLKTGDPQLWQNIQKAVSSGKRDFLFGQTAPSISNSGLQTFMLMAATFHGKSSVTAADIQDPKFVEWLTTYAKNIEKFGDSTGTFMEDMVRFGPSRYAAVAVYESNALERIQAANNRWGDIRMIYPAVNIWSDHPLAILDASWVNADQRAAAAQFRDFLLAQPQQEAAVRAGFRPANPDAGLDIADSPFTKYKDQYGVQIAPASVINDPDAATIQAILDLWKQLEPQVRR